MDALLDQQRLLDDVETAKLLGVSVATLATWRCRRRQNLPFFKIGKLVRYRLADIEEWLESRRKQGI
jgi:excisionase family DNA binding protein